MAPTTLITFMVRTPPTTRRVSLYGSWDNFSQPYALQRDSRIGPEHWSGCHKFSNIIFDGQRDNTGYLPRDGGLKMGGTYWYYYKLDDDLDFYNSAEPTTTRCPLLPGQLVNVLQIPYALSGNRSRNASMSSTSSELRTMEPSDKYVNPRPVVRPRLQRLQTSPTSLSGVNWSTSASSSSATASATTLRGGWSASSMQSSAPSSATTLKMPSLSRKASHESSRANHSRNNSRNRSRNPSSNPSRNPSPAKTLATGVATAFRSLNLLKSTSPEQEGPGEGGDWRPERNSDPSGSEPAVQRPDHTHSQTRSVSSSSARANGEHDLLFRRRPTSGGSMDSLTFSSFAEHRRQRSRSRESRSQSLRGSLGLSDRGAAEGPNEAAERRAQLSTVKEVASAQNTPGFGMGIMGMAGHKGVGTGGFQKTASTLNLEKRLPTLPNSPSSAYQASTTEGEDGAKADDEIEFHYSHFSSTTIETDVSAVTPLSQSAQSTEFSESIDTGVTSRSSWELSRHGEINYDYDGTDNNNPTERIVRQPTGSNREQVTTTPRTGRTGNETEIEDTPQTSSTSSIFPSLSATAVTLTAGTGGLAAAVRAHYQDYRQYYQLTAGEEDFAFNKTLLMKSATMPIPAPVAAAAAAAAESESEFESEADTNITTTTDNNITTTTDNDSYYQVPTFQQFIHQHQNHSRRRSRSLSLGKTQAQILHDSSGGYEQPQQRPQRPQPPQQKQFPAPTPAGNAVPVSGHSSTMQELLAELSYLGNLINR